MSSTSPFPDTATEVAARGLTPHALAFDVARHILARRAAGKPTTRLLAHPDLEADLRRAAFPGHSFLSAPPACRGPHVEIVGLVVEPDVSVPPETVVVM